MSPGDPAGSLTAMCPSKPTDESEMSSDEPHAASPGTTGPESLRIARILTRMNLGGPARQVLASDPELTRRGHRTRVFVGNPEAGEGDLFDAAVAAGIDVVRVPGLGRSVRGLGELRARSFLKAALGEFEPHVVHTHASKAGALGRSVARRSVPEAARVHTFHGHVLEGYFPGPVSRMIRALERRLARTTDRVLAVSHQTAEDLLRLGVADVSQLVVVPPGVELGPLLGLDARGGALRRLCGVGEQDCLVGVIGRLAEVKRPDWAVDVFEVLARRHPGLHLVFIGDGDQRQVLESRIRGLDRGLGERVHLVGAREDMVEVLGDLDVVLSTSRTEGMPVALIEAGAAGIPVVATPVGGVPELVAPGRTGFLGEDVDELAFGLEPFLLDPKLRAETGRRARLRVEKQHSARALADRLEAVYRAVVKTP